MTSRLEVLHYSSVDSTNDEAKRLLRRGAIRQVAVVLADEQTAGRGTRGRMWCSPRGAGLYFSLAQRYDATGVQLTTDYTRAAGIACAAVLGERFGVDVRLKPINDLLIAGRKLGGILTEALLVDGNLKALITGVGINIADAPRVMPDGSPIRDTSLAAHVTPLVVRGTDRHALVLSLAQRIEFWHRRVRAGARVELDRVWVRFGAAPGKASAGGGEARLPVS
jgi:BirA family biotin operon repressor/biotin-[acetyl-CoA-carboxylase] ligase